MALWRLALMFDAPGHDLDVLRHSLSQSGDAIRRLARGNPVRTGVADRHPDLGAWAQRDPGKGWADVDGSIEITLSDPPAVQISAICRDLRPIMLEFCELPTLQVMAGPIFSMVPVRAGDTFLSLAFRRDPAVSVAQFRDWWFNRHSNVAIPVLGSGLLAYDQVHVEEDQSVEAADALGVAYAPYDAYDNLTWADRYGYLDSISDEEAMAPVFADEVGWIDPTSRRSAIMTEVN